MDVMKRINQLMKERGWSAYRLAAESGLSTSTIANMYRRNSLPSIPTLEIICQAFGITLAQFFSEEEMSVQLTEEQMLLFNDWMVLTDSQKSVVEAIIKELKAV